MVSRFCTFVFHLFAEANLLYVLSIFYLLNFDKLEVICFLNKGEKSSLLFHDEDTFIIIPLYCVFMYRSQIHYLKRMVQPVTVRSQRSTAYFKNGSGLNVNLSKLFLTGDVNGLVDLTWRRTDSEFWFTLCDSYK